MLKSLLHFIKYNLQINIQCVGFARIYTFEVNIVVMICDYLPAEII